MADSLIEGAVKKAYPNATFKYMQSSSGGKIAVTAGKATGMALDKSELDSIIGAGGSGLKMHSDGVIGNSGYVAVGISKASKIPDAKAKTGGGSFSRGCL